MTRRRSEQSAVWCSCPAPLSVVVPVREPVEGREVQAQHVARVAHVGEDVHESALAVIVLVVARLPQRVVEARCGDHARAAHSAPRARFSAASAPSQNRSTSLVYIGVLDPATPTNQTRTPPLSQVIRW